MQDKINVENENNVQDTKDPQASAPKKKDPLKIYRSRLSKYNTFYLLIVIISAIILAAGIYLAVAVNLLWGFAAFIGAIAIYAYCTADELHKKLGLWYKIERGTLTVTKCRAKYGGAFYIPRKLLWHDVTEIADSAFLSPEGKNAVLQAVYLPKTIKKIGEDVFESCILLKEVHFEGTAEDFAKIACHSSLDGIEVIFESYPDVKK